MKKIIQQVLDFPQSVNQQIFKGRINDAVDSFDGQNGVRSYVSSIYEYIAFAVFVWMEYNLLMAAYTYLTFNASTSVFLYKSNKSFCFFNNCSSGYSIPAKPSG